MNKLLFLVMGTTLITLLTSTANSQMLSQGETDCKDMMAILVDKPQELQFLECKPTKHMQLNVLETSYQVPGKDAGEVEKFLQQKFKMSKLRFLCCGWEPIEVIKNENYPGYGGYRDSLGYNYQIRMFSGETLINQRQDWKSIPFFYIRVIKFIESP